MRVKIIGFIVVSLKAASLPGRGTKRNSAAHSNLSCELMTQVLLIVSKAIITSGKAAVEAPR